ncbi:MAG: T9SS type A sorting domain-containing protein [Chitinophagales bacterium]
MKKNTVLLLFFIHAVFVQTQAKTTGIRYKSQGSVLLLSMADIREGLASSKFSDNTCNSGLIPLQLMLFTGHAEGSDVKLTWRTTMQQNNHGFNVQYSTDGCSWQSVGFVAGAENNSVVMNYQFTHFHPAGIVNYYRLEQADFDGNKNYSPVVEVQFEQKGISVLLYPNPVTTTIFAQLRSGSYRFGIQIMDMNGKTVRTYDEVMGDRIVPLDVSAFKCGIYIVEIDNPTNKAFNEKFKIQKL